MRTKLRLRVMLTRLLALIFSCAFFPVQGAEVSPKTPTADAGGPALLLANVWNPSIDPTGWWISEKYDGLRGYWDGRKLWSRKGTPIQAPDYFLAELPKDIALDGELWMGRGQFEETLSTVLAQTPDDRWKKMHFMVFDAPKAEGTFEQRTKFVLETLPKENQFAKPVVQYLCKGTAHLIAERDRVVALGGEGLMLRQPESAYDPRRSPTLLKVKPQDDAEATVIAHLPGKGKYADQLGSLRVRTADGIEFSIGSGLSDALRATPPPVGTVITYRFRGVTKNGLPRFPSFLRVRRE
ncbi:MAG: DNA ligase [Chthoniobacter sp.]|nr:DNA ligase [Chthoniobacter sp.]